MSRIITIDGPASAGKGTLSRQLAKTLGYSHLDNGSIFRSASLALIKAGINLNNADKLEIIKIIQNINLEIKWDGELCRVYLDGVEATKDISDLEVGRITSILASDRDYFIALSELTRKMAIDGNFVSDGRAVGSFIFPNADINSILLHLPK